MKSQVELLTFAGVMVLGQFSPGPDMILLTRTALKSGVRAGVEMALGIACGLIVHSTLAVAGLALVFDHSPIWRRTLTILAAGYLLYLAWRILIEVWAQWHATVLVKTLTETDARRPFFRGLFCNLCNPKAAIFIAAVSAPFLREVHADWWPFVLVAIVVGQGALLWALWAYLLQWKPLRSRYDHAAKWIDLTFAMALLAIAIRLLIG